MNCKNCDTEVALKYCPNCGQSATINRIDGKYILHEIEHVLHFDRGIFYTIKELVINPGESIRNYLSENRTKLIKPILFIIVTSLIYTLVSHFYHLESTKVIIKGLKTDSFSTILSWTQENWGYTNIMTAAIRAYLLQILFKKYGYNFYELLILFCYITGVSMLIYALFIPIEILFESKIILFFTLMLGPIYSVWAVAQFFDKTKVVSYIKALIAYVLGTVILFILFF